jgi:excisionase family DNA binding protein
MTRRPPADPPASALTGLRYWTVKEAAAHLRVSKMSIYRLVHSRDLDAIRVGRSFRIPQDAITRYLKDADTRPSSPDDIRRAVTTALDGTGLHLTQTTGDLVITNPRRPDRGEINVSLEDAGYISWLRETSDVYGDQTDYYGHLEGMTSDHHDDHPRRGPRHRIRARPVPGPRLPRGPRLRTRPLSGHRPLRRVTPGVTPAEIKVRATAQWQERHPRLSRIFRYPDPPAWLPGTGTP